MTDQYLARGLSIYRKALPKDESGNMKQHVLILDVVVYRHVAISGKANKMV